MLTALAQFKERIFILTIVLIISISAQAEAAQVVPYSPDLSLVKISKDSATMMKFPEHIRKVIISEDAPLEIKMEDKAAFLKFERPYSKTINAYFVGENETYSLTLAPSNIKDSIIYIQGPEKIRERSLEWEKGNLYEEMMAVLIKKIYNREIPPGYKVQTGGKDESPFNEVKMVRELTLTGDLYSISQYELENIGKTEGIYNEEEFYKNGVVAISIVKHSLESGEKTKIYVVKRRRVSVKSD